MNKYKKLFRIKEKKMIAGVCAGIAEYFSIDVTIIRLIWLILSVVLGIGVITYLLALIVMPIKPISKENVIKNN